MSGFKSQKQRMKFKELVKAGKITQESFDRLDRASSKELPERLHHKKIKVRKVRVI